MDSSLLERNRTRLVEMRARLIPTVQNIESAIVEDVRAPGDISNAPTHLATNGDEGVDRDVALARNEAGILEEVEAALGRIENGTYGRCEDCRQEIAHERLDALPYTRYCIKCAEKHDEIWGITP